MPTPELPVGLPTSVVEDAIRSEDTLYMVGVDGSPGVVGSPKSTASDCDSADSCGYAVDDFQEEVEQGIAEMKATAPEADTLGAIAEAARQIGASPGLRQIIVIDNGLQTDGAFRLQGTRVLFSDEETDMDLLAERLRNESRLEPALEGVVVTWVGLASSSPPQEVADQRPRANLRKLWEKILAAAGAKVTFVGGLQDGEPPAHPDLPPVTPVDVTDEPIDATDPCPTIFDDQVGFVPNEAEFRDPARARQALEPIARGLITRQQSASLVGYVALPERPGPLPLSLSRAQAVHALLVQLGVPASLMAPVGGGLAPEASGASEPAEALAQYRRVEVISGECGTGGTP